MQKGRKKKNTNFPGWQSGATHVKKTQWRCQESCKQQHVMLRSWINVVSCLLPAAPPLTWTLPSSLLHWVKVKSFVFISVFPQSLKVLSVPLLRMTARCIQKLQWKFVSVVHCCKRLHLQETQHVLLAAHSKPRKVFYEIKCFGERDRIRCFIFEQWHSLNDWVQADVSTGKRNNNSKRYISYRTYLQSASQT